MRGCMIKKLTKAFAGILSFCMCTVSVSATETQLIEYDSTQNEITSKYVNVDVDAERAEIYAVTLPKRVTLDVVDDIATFNYDVGVVGEISSTHYVRVIPLDGVTMSNGVTAVNLGVTQEKRRFNSDEVLTSTTTSGTMSVDGLEPGKYDGTVKFYVTLDDGGYWTAANCTEPAYCMGYDSNDNAKLDTEDTNNNGVLDILNEDIDGDGVLDVAETDTNGDGVVDIDEDIDGDGKFDTAEDTNSNGVLDVINEDINGNGLLDTEYLEHVVVKGTALGHKFADGCTDFPALCERCCETIFAINTPEQLVAFRDSVNAGSSYTNTEVVLNADIDMTGVVWNASIGTYYKPFSGTFNGLGHSINNLTMNFSSTELNAIDYATDGVGFFNCISTNSVLKNFVMNNVTYKYTFDSADSSHSKEEFGIVVGAVGCSGDANTAAPKIEGVHVRNSNMIVDNTKYANVSGYGMSIAVGGLVGDHVYGNLKNCSVVNTDIVVMGTSSDTVRVGGIAGSPETYSASVFSNLFSAVNVSVVSASANSIGVHPIVGRWGNIGKFAMNNTVADITKCNTLSTNANWTAVSTVETNCHYLTTTECQTQETIDILNTGLDTPYWKMDLENVNGGYPVPIY